MTSASEIDVLKQAIKKCKLLFDEKLRECKRCKIYDFLPILNNEEVYDWSREPLVALYQKQFIIQSSLFELQDEYRVLNLQNADYIADPDDAKLIEICEVDVFMRDIHFSETDTYLLALEDTAAQILLEHYRDYDRFFSARSDTVAGLLESFWAKFRDFSESDEAYMTLGVTAQTSWEDIQKAYRLLASEHHPDRGGEGEQFIQIRKAFETLKRRHQS